MYKEDMVCVYIYTYTHTHTHNGILLSHKNEIMLFAATWIELQNSPSQASVDVNHELPDVQAGFRKGRGTRD